MINKIFNFILTFLAACVVQMLAFAVWQSTQDQMATLNGSRIGIVWVGLALSVVFAILVTWVFARKELVAKLTEPTTALTVERLAKLTRSGDYTQMFREIAEVPQEQRSALLGGSAEVPMEKRRARNPAVQNAERQFVAFDVNVPPLASPKYQSWFGGLPLVTHSFVWPSYEQKDGKSVPLAFLLQLDCAQLSSKAGLGLMPHEGLLQFYIDTAEGLGKSFAVRYIDRTGKLLSLAKMPSDLPPLFDAQGKSWMIDLPDASALATQLLPRWTFDLVHLVIPSEFFGVEDDERNYWDFPTDYELEGVDWSGQFEVQPDFQLRKSSPAARPCSNFPQDWRAVLISCATILKSLERHRTDKDKMADIHSHATRWLTLARDHEQHAALSQMQSDEFWAWIEQNNAQLYLGRAAEEALAATASDPNGTGVTLSSDGLDFIRRQKRFPVFHNGNLKVDKPIRLLSAGSDVQGMSEDVARDHIMLLELSSDPLLGLNIGEGVLQFWIKPEDLEARHFDEVVLLAGAY